MAVSKEIVGKKTIYRMADKQPLSHLGISQTTYIAKANCWYFFQVCVRNTCGITYVCQLPAKNSSRQKFTEGVGYCRKQWFIQLLYKLLFCRSRRSSANTSANSANQNSSQPFSPLLLEISHLQRYGQCLYVSLLAFPSSELFLDVYKHSYTVALSTITCLGGYSQVHFFQNMGFQRRESATWLGIIRYNCSCPLPLLA